MMEQGGVVKVPQERGAIGHSVTETGNKSNMELEAVFPEEQRCGADDLSGGIFPENISPTNPGYHREVVATYG